MGITIFIMFFTLLIPIIMLSAGLLMKKRPPKDINGIYGFRTSMSMKSKATWDFAHEFCGRLWTRWGVISLLLSFIISLVGIRMNETVKVITMLSLVTIQTILIIASIYPVNKALEENFNEYGERR